MTTVTAPGFWDVPESDYHADTQLAPRLGRSLSTSGAKVLLQSPAKFHWQREHGSPPKDAFDFGHAAHRLILGEGATIHRVNATDWRTKAAQAEKETARAAGRTPILNHDYRAALQMAKAVKRHPTAGPLFVGGEVEHSFYWVDDATGVTRRARADYLRPDCFVDLKTTADASPEGFAKSVANFGYDMQADAYITGHETLTGDRIPFYFVAVEKAAPHLVAVYELDDVSLAVGHARNAEALALFAQCESDQSWPGYPLGVTPLSSPAWHTRPYQGVIL